MYIIIIPYRDREEQLNYFIEKTTELFKKCLCDVKVIIVEQNNQIYFNRGKLINIGFDIYKNTGKYFFTQDVDIIPNELAINNFYKYNNSSNLYLY